MSLRLIYGRAGSGKSCCCYKEIKKKIEEDFEGPLILVVPDQFSFQAEKNLIELAGDKAVDKAEVLSFKRMAYRVFNEVGGITAEHMNGAGRSMLIYSIMEENQDKLSVFAKVSKKTGFVKTISDLITEFKRYDVSLEQMNDIIERIEDENLREKLEDLRFIYGEFERRLHENYIDGEDDLTILAEKLDKSKMFDGAEIWMDEFSTFTPQQYKIVEKLIKKAKRVSVTLCSDGNSDVFLPTLSTEKKLMKIIEKINARYEKPVTLKCNPCERFKDNMELAHMEQNVFAYPYRTYEGSAGNIKVFKALNRYGEVEATAREIIKLCREKGYRFKDVAIATGDLQGYESLVKAVLDQYEIPYFIDQKREIMSNPLIVLIVSAVEIYSKKWSYDSVFRYLKTGLLNMTSEETDILENFVLSNGIRGSKWTDEEEWKYGLYQDMDDKQQAKVQEELKKVNAIRFKAVEPLKKFHQKLKGKRPACELCEALYDFLNDMGAVGLIEEVIQMFKSDGQLDKANVFNQIWNMVVQLLDQVVEVLGESQITAEEFARILSTGFSEYEIGLIPPAIDQVLVSSVNRVRNHSIKALFILGVNDGIFPAGNLSEGVLSDKDRELLKDRGMELAVDTKTKAFEEQFLMYEILTIPSEQLALSYSVADLEGKTLRPSILISRIKKIFPDIKERSDMIDEGNDLDKIVGPKSTFNQLIASISKNVSEVQIDPLWVEVMRWYRKNECWKESVDRVIKGFDHSNEAEVYDTRRIRKLYGSTLNVSVSRIEKFTACPFSYFVQYGLKAKERKIFKLSSPDLGTLMHEVLKKFSIEIRERNMSWTDLTKEWCEPEVSRIVDKTVDEAGWGIFNSSPRYDHMKSNLKKVLARSVSLITEHMSRGGFLPTGYEISFAKVGEFPPIKITMHSGEQANLIGRVDRIDVLKEDEKLYLRIIDYKSGNKEFKLSDVYNGLQLQLLIYLDAILTEMCGELGEDAEPGAILYFKLDDPMIKANGNLPDEEIEKKIMTALKMNGLVLSDVEIIKEMDREIDGSSMIVPVRLKKDGTVSTSMSSVASREQFAMLRKFVRKTIANKCEEMLEGDISIRPYKNQKKTPCEYCLYSAICQFDSSIKGNSYNMINDLKDDQCWQAIEKSLKQ